MITRLGASPLWQRTSSQSSRNWNERMKQSSHWSPQILGTLPLDKIRDMSLRHLCMQRNTCANVAALPGYKDRRAFGCSRRMQAQTTSSSQTSICFVSCLLFVLAAFCCRKSLDLAFLPCRSNRWLWIGAPQLSHLRFKDWQSAGVSSWTTAEWNPVKVHNLKDTSQQLSKKQWSGSVPRRCGFWSSTCGQKRHTR